MGYWDFTNVGARVSEACEQTVRELFSCVGYGPAVEVNELQMRHAAPRGFNVAGCWHTSGLGNGGEPVWYTDLDPMYLVSLLRALCPGSAVCVRKIQGSSVSGEERLLDTVYDAFALTVTQEWDGSYDSKYRTGRKTVPFEPPQLPFRLIPELSSRARKRGYTALSDRLTHITETGSAHTQSPRLLGWELWDGDEPYKKYVQRSPRSKAAARLKPVKPGTCPVVRFGACPQQTPAVPEPIEWLVIDNKDESALLLSRRALDTVPYSSSPAAWEDSLLRRWLNSDFISAAFTAEEQAALVPVTHAAGWNPEYRVQDAVQTTDMVFVLSAEEAEGYLARNEDRVCHSTAYARSRSEGYDRSSGCWWWLRTPGKNPTCAVSVDRYGYINAKGSSGSNARVRVRPCVWVNTGILKTLPPRGADAAEADRALKASAPGYETLTFGVCHQADKTSLDPITWLVLEKENDGTALLLSLLPVDISRYDGGRWQDSSLRRWLNTEFFSLAFTPEEAERILYTEISDPYGCTCDRLFLPDEDQTAKYLPETTPLRVCKSTPYTAGKRYGLKDAPCKWFLLSGRLIKEDGALRYGGGLHEVRPCLRIRLDQIQNTF